jgi:hypothetical protein
MTGAQAFCSRDLQIAAGRAAAIWRSRLQGLPSGGRLGLP